MQPETWMLSGQRFWSTISPSSRLGTSRRKKLPSRRLQPSLPLLCSFPLHPQPSSTQPSTTQSSKSQSQTETPQPSVSHSPSPTLSSPKPSKWKTIPRPRGNVQTSTAPATSALPNSTPTFSLPTTTLLEAELTSALAKATSSPSIPTEVELTSTSNIATNPPLRELSIVPEGEEEEQDEDVTITGCISPHTTLFQSVQLQKDKLSSRAEDYINDHFPTLFNFLKVCKLVNQLVQLVILKTSRWGYIRERASVGTWEALINEEEEVLSTFDICSLWLSS